MRLALVALTFAAAACGTPAAELPGDAPVDPPVQVGVAAEPVVAAMDPLRPACEAGDRARCAAALAERGLRLPEFAVACAGGQPAHTLVVRAAGIEVDGVAQADAEAAFTTLRAAGAGEVAVMIDADRTLRGLRPVLALLSRLAPASRLFVSVLPADSSEVVHVPIAGVAIAASAPVQPAHHEGGYLLYIDVTMSTVYDLVASERRVVTDARLEGASLLVAATEATPWGAIAEGLVRACGSARLIETRSAPGGRLPTATRTGGRPPPAIVPDLVRRIVRAHINEVRACYDKALAGDPNARGRVEIRFTVAASGAVERTEIVETTMKDAEVGTCIARATRRWRFPRPEGGQAMFNYPFVLEPG